MKFSVLGSTPFCDSHEEDVQLACSADESGFVFFLNSVRSRNSVFVAHLFPSQVFRQLIKFSL